MAMEEEEEPKEEEGSVTTNPNTLQKSRELPKAISPRKLPKAVDNGCLPKAYRRPKILRKAKPWKCMAAEHTAATSKEAYGLHKTKITPKLHHGWKEHFTTLEWLSVQTAKWKMDLVSCGVFTVVSILFGRKKCIHGPKSFQLEEVMHTRWVWLSISMESPRAYKMAMEEEEEPKEEEGSVTTNPNTLQKSRELPKAISPRKLPKAVDNGCLPKAYRRPKILRKAKPWKCMAAEHTAATSKEAYGLHKTKITPKLHHGWMEHFTTLEWLSVQTAKWKMDLVSCGVFTVVSILFGRKKCIHGPKSFQLEEVVEVVIHGWKKTELSFLFEIEEVIRCGAGWVLGNCFRVEGKILLDENKKMYTEVELFFYCTEEPYI
ncbi:hypothetical protein LR48_Vigan07g199200 [Vigna angularis]|uniref:Uncharacterized protein n=1 Tax=Phaseolus angularis TaxID=3914 RepID=A0A0L9UZT1_PHAAN|nr:hypothetical protein LR48_Vigan07g199200 [Vigna angularis]